MWSDELQKSTRDHFERIPMALMKHFGDMSFGFCIMKDGKYTILDMKEESDKKWVYKTIDEMLNAGWAID